METLTATRTARFFRLDEESWRRIAATGSLGGSAFVAIGAYAILAFDRFGINGLVDPRATVRLLLIGLYGWLWLAVASWLMARFALRIDAEFMAVVRLYGSVHLPLVFTAVAIQVFAMVGQILGPALLVGAVSVLMWMPAMLAAATGFPSASPVPRRPW